MAACQPSNQPPQRTRRSRTHSFRISQISIAQCAVFSASHPPRVLSLAAFGRRPPVYVAPMSLAGIRNPQQNRKSARAAVTSALPLNNGHRQIAPAGSIHRWFHSEWKANLLIHLGSDSTGYSECALISLEVLPDFDSTIRRFESSRPSQTVRQLQIVTLESLEMPAKCGLS